MIEARVRADSQIDPTTVRASYQHTNKVARSTHRLLAMCRWYPKISKR